MVPCTQGGELALGRNVLVAFMPWNGYNFETQSSSANGIVKEDVFTSSTLTNSRSAHAIPSSAEEITRDIPNLGDEALKNLGPTGVIRVGAEVKPGDFSSARSRPRAKRTRAGRAPAARDLR